MAAAPFLFKCHAKDGRLVRLARERYQDHILAGHPELAGDFADAPAQIKIALEEAVTIRDTYSRNKVEYIGPLVTPDGLAPAFSGKKTPRRFHVIVWKEPAHAGHVVTAWSQT